MHAALLGADRVRGLQFPSLYCTQDVCVYMLRDVQLPSLSMWCTSVTSYLHAVIVHNFHLFSARSVSKHPTCDGRALIHRASMP